MRFTKMQGIGNDYIYVNCLEEKVKNPQALAKAMSKRHFGVGADGLVLIERSAVADFGMRIFNADGSESEMCGNATRCIAKYVFERGFTDKTELTLEAKGGLRFLWLNIENGEVVSVRVDMGSPVLNPRLVPVNLPGEAVLNHHFRLGGHMYTISCVSVGNPHCVVFCDEPDLIDLSLIGPLFENHSIFPNRTNTEFMKIVKRDWIRLRVWERGAGETMACGTGASAALVAAVLSGRADRLATVELNGGNLLVEWRAEDNHVYQTGPAAFVFDGEWLVG
jgi:diaminopimelate epimerase